MLKYGKNGLTITQKLMMELLVNYKKKFSSWFAFLALQKKIQGVITQKLVKNRDFWLQEGNN